MRATALIVCILITTLFTTQAQQEEKATGPFRVFKKETYGKNVLKYNLMPAAIFREPKNVSFSYERVVREGQSFSVGGGYLFFPNYVGNIGAINVVIGNNSGYTGNIDYRFYLRQLNERPAPNGIYIAPFYSIYNHRGTVDFRYVDNSGNSPLAYQARISNNFTFHNFGVELGYQFIFFKRLTMDMILCGPAYSVYNIDFNIQSDLSADKKSELYQRYADRFFDQVPLFKKIMDKADFYKNGRSSGLTPNFRYTVQIGWHF
jgi:hypothetical protein